MAPKPSACPPIVTTEGHAPGRPRQLFFAPTAVFSHFLWDDATSRKRSAEPRWGAGQGRRGAARRGAARLVLSAGQGRTTLRNLGEPRAAEKGEGGPKRAGRAERGMPTTGAAVLRSRHAPTVRRRAPRHRSPTADTMASAARASPSVRMGALLAASLLALVLPPVAAQVPFLGKCPSKEVQQDFNATAYLGKWYEQERYFAVFQLGGNCVTATYTDEGDGRVGVLNAQTNLVSGRKTSISGFARLAGDGTEGKLKVTFPSMGNFEADYWVLETDYENYAVVWSCTPIFGVSNVQFAWVLTRARAPGVEVMARVREALDSRKVELLPFRRTLQKREQCVHKINIFFKISFEDYFFSNHVFPTSIPAILM
ncbi:Lazarillo protein [Gryllus bimaculatus]|nr:Lazarillo protein [Gryllus bimaculatus]